MKTRMLIRASLAAVLALGATSLAQAEMVLSQVIVDLMPGKPLRDDIEVWNDSRERMYVAADPFEIRNPGTPQEQRVPAADPEQSGLLVAPQRLVLEPGERRLVRIAATGERPGADRIYRVSIKPVAGAVTADRSALKVLVGYDTLVLVRPAQFTGDVTGQRTGKTLTLTNAGNTSQELFDGRQCDASGKDCRDLPAKRLYAGATWSQPMPFDTPVSYKASIGGTVRQRTF
jgi:P pilus assembly chaperone PapD